MKRLLYLFCLPLLLLACGGDDDAEPSKDSGNCLTVELDGELFEAETVTLQKLPTFVDSSGVTIESDLYTILGFGAVEGLFSVPPTYTIVFGCLQIRDQAESDPLSADCGLGSSYTNLDVTNGTGDNFESDGMSGSLRITRVTDTRIEGTFAFDLQGSNASNNATIEARNGFFSIER